MSRDLTIVHIASVTLRTAYTMWMSRDPGAIYAASVVHFLVLPSKRICPLLCALPVLFHHLDLKQMVPSPVIDLVEWDCPCSFRTGSRGLIMLTENQVLGRFYMSQFNNFRILVKFNFICHDSIILVFW